MLLAASGQGAAEASIRAAGQKRAFGHFHHTAHALACAYALMNKPRQAVEWLRASADEGFPNYPVFAGDPSLASLAKDPEFIVLMDQLKQQWERFKATL